MSSRRGEALQERLQEADPCRWEAPLQLEERARLRRGLFHGAPDASPGWFHRHTTRWAVGLAIAAALGGGVSLLWTPPPTQKTETPGDKGSAREIHFETPGGTQLVWVLDPEFKL